MKLITIILLLVSNYLHATLLKPSSFTSNEDMKIQNIISNVIYDEIYKISKNINLKPIKVISEKQNSTSLNNGKRGEMIIEMMKRKNREKIAKLRGLDPTKADSGSDLVEQQRKRNKKLIDQLRAAEKKLSKKYESLPLAQRKSLIWQAQAKIEMENLKNRVLSQAGWRDKNINILNSWKDEKKDFIKRESEYRNAISTIPLVLSVSETKIKKPVQNEVVKEDHYVPSAMAIPIKDQGKRPTCSAFAGIRAVEVLLRQNRSFLDLSEQYFYWASKPKCRKQKCADAGSWVGHGLEFSKNNQLFDIPKEDDCSYSQQNLYLNDSQVPLRRTCRQGVVKINRFKYIEGLDQLINELSNGRPVIAGFKLSDNFYRNKGLVLAKDAKASKRSDSHVKGHAVLLVGYIRLPRVLKEGKVCFVTANSWGSGWGHGGHACLSENWVVKHRQRNPFVVITEIKKADS